jgi:CubicO group peptidase (beta-lactamase class C family)
MAVKPEQVGLSEERLARITGHLKSRYVTPQKIMGCSTLVARRGEIVYRTDLGKMDIERDKDLAADTIFRIYSMTKPVTSVALMMLYEQGHFQLADPVHKFIPQWRDLQVYSEGEYPDFQTVPVERHMTVRDLLSHQAGLTYGFQGPEQSALDTAYQYLEVQGNRNGSTLQDMVDKLAGLPLEYSPGTAWKYSMATDVCGYLVEVLSGMTLEEFFKQQIFDPLGMTDTGFTVPEDQVHRFAANYHRRSDKTLGLEDDPKTSRYLRPQTFFSGGGGLVSTMSDYYRFCQMLLNGGELDGHRLLGPRTVSLMTRNHLTDSQDLTQMAQDGFSETTNDGIGFGLGFASVMDPVVAQAIGSAGEYYWGGAASTIFWIDPTEELIVILMTQLMPSGTFNFRGQLKSIIYPAIID